VPKPGAAAGQAPAAGKAAFLEACFERYHRTAYLRPDPLELAHGWDRREDAEVAALIAASVSLGAIDQIVRAGRDLLRRLGASPATTLRTSTVAQLRKKLEGCRYRFYREEHFGALLDLLGQALRRDGSLGETFEAAVAAPPGDEPEPDLRPALARFLERIAGGDATAWLPASTTSPVDQRAFLAHLLPDARGTSACKRHHMLLRWMVRPADGIDLGFWSFAGPERLLIPVDVHIGRMSRYLGLNPATTKTMGLATSRAITAELRRIDPADPVRFDFALTRLGLALNLRGECEVDALATRCASCQMRPDCLRTRELARPPRRRPSARRAR
jgi:uncharacterized protein (TIGR02757 family)